MSVADAVRVVEPTSAYAEFDLRRMRRERLARTRHSLRAHQLPAALLFDPLNVWYAVVEGAMPVFNLHVSFRWALVPVESEPVLWEYPESMHLTGAAWSGDLRAAKGWSFFGSGSNSEADTRAFAAQVARVLSERGLLGEPIGVDRLETAGHLALAEAGITMVDAQPAMERARAIKTPDELIAIRTNARNCDRAIEEMLGRMRPGVTENQLWGTLVGTGLQTGALWCETRLLSSGPRTNPWMQEATHREVQDGDLVAFDTDLVGENGYLTDISRTYLCGDRPPSDTQRRLYQTSYEFLQTCLPEFKAGASFAELGRKLSPRLPEEFHAQRYPFIAHGTGLVDEYPCVNFEHHHDGELEVGMVMSIESYIGAVGGSVGVKLEEQVVIGEHGPELISTAPFDERLLA